MDRFNHKVIFITGASSGLGKTTTRKMIAEGAHVFGVARNENKLAALKSEFDNNFSYTVCDVSQPAQCKAAIDQCLVQHQQIDSLINIAGQHTFRHTKNISESDWHDDIATNLNGPFYLCQAALPALLKQKGSIVNIASIAGLQGQPYSAGYCAAKHGLIGLTKSLAMEFMKEDIRINAICPGGMDTPQVQNMQLPENCDFDLLMRSAAPRGFMQADDVANVILFLASDEARAIHGAIYEVDQGKTVG